MRVSLQPVCGCLFSSPLGVGSALSIRCSQLPALGPRRSTCRSQLSALHSRPSALDHWQLPPVALAITAAQPRPSRSATREGRGRSVPAHEPTCSPQWRSAAISQRALRHATLRGALRGDERDLDYGRSRAVSESLEQSRSLLRQRAVGIGPVGNRSATTRAAASTFSQADDRGADG